MRTNYGKQTIECQVNDFLNKVYSEMNVSLRWKNSRRICKERYFGKSVSVKARFGAFLVTYRLFARGATISMSVTRSVFRGQRPRSVLRLWLLSPDREDPETTKKTKNSRAGPREMQRPY